MLKVSAKCPKNFSAPIVLKKDKKEKKLKAQEIIEGRP